MPFVIISSFPILKADLFALAPCNLLATRELRESELQIRATQARILAHPVRLSGVFLFVPVSSEIA
jgi:hypothetical protein